MDLCKKKQLNSKLSICNGYIPEIHANWFLRTSCDLKTIFFDFFDVGHDLFA